MAAVIDMSVLWANGFITMLIFISALLLKYTIFKDKESEGIKWLISGGLMNLLYSVAPIGPMAAVISETITFVLPAFILLLPIGYILILIGCIKVIVQMFK